MQPKHSLRLFIAGLSVLSCAIAACQQSYYAKSQLADPIGKIPFPVTSEKYVLPVKPSPNTAYIPTVDNTVDAMLRLVAISANDTVYDVGSGDGRVLINAARNYGAKGVGIEFSLALVKQARLNAEEAGVGDRVEFRNQDAFTANLDEATVVVLYLQPEINLQLRSKLLEELRPGTRVVSHTFGMGNWPPTQALKVDGNMVYVWVVPGNTSE